MNKIDSSAAIATAGKDSVLNMNDSGLMQLAQAESQQPVTAVVEVPAKAKGNFSAQATVGELIEFQFTGLLVVFVVLGGLTLMSMLIAKILQVVAPNQYYGTSKPAPVAPAVVAPAAAPALKTLHPGLSDEKLLAILAVAAQEAVGQAVSVVKFRHLESMDWTWSVQGRVGLHSHKL